MAQLDTTTIGYQLKNVYGDRVTDLFKRQAMTYNLFAKSSRKSTYKPAGAGYVFSTRQAANESVGGRAEGALLPEPLAGDGVQGSISPKLLYAVIRLSGLAIEAGKGNIAAFVDAQGDAIMDSYKALISDLNRQCHGDGYGLLGTLSAAATPSTSSEWTVTCVNDRGVRYLRKGMIVDFYTGGTTLDVSAAAQRIASVNPNAQTIEMETITTGASAGTYQASHPLAAARSATLATANVLASAEIVRYGSRIQAHTTSAASYEMMGLNGIYDDGTLLAAFEGITVTADPEWKANVMDNSSVGRELTIDLMLAAMDMTSSRSDMEAGIIRMGIGQRRKYFGLLAPDIRFQPLTLKGGYEKLAFSQNGSVSIIVDPYTQPNRLYFEVEGAIKKYELTPIGWGGFEPQKMHWRQDYDEGTMFLRTYTNLGTEKRNCLTLLDDLTEPASAPW